MGITNLKRLIMPCFLSVKYFLTVIYLLAMSCAEYMERKESFVFCFNPNGYMIT